MNAEIAAAVKLELDGLEGRFNAKLQQQQQRHFDLQERVEIVERCMGLAKVISLAEQYLFAPCYKRWRAIYRVLAPSWRYMVCCTVSGNYWMPESKVYLRQRP